MQDRICQCRVAIRLSYWFLLWAGFLAAPSFAAEKQILLRTESIHTSGLKRQAQELSGAPITGLFLVQLANNPPGDWRAQLEAANVRLLRPVPDDAFVAHLHAGDPAAVSQLPFVQYFGPYKAAHKTHPKIAELASGARGGETQVKVLLAQSAREAETALIQRQFSGAPEIEKLRFGSVLTGSIPTHALGQVISSDAVLWIEPAPEARLLDAVSAQMVLGPGTGSTPAIHELGFDGAGVTVSVADSGLDMGEFEGIHPDFSGRIEAFFHYGTLDTAAAPAT